MTYLLFVNGVNMRKKWNGVNGVLFACSVVACSESAAPLHVDAPAAPGPTIVASQHERPDAGRTVDRTVDASLEGSVRVVGVLEGRQAAKGGAGRPADVEGCHSAWLALEAGRAGEPRGDTFGVLGKEGGWTRSFPYGANTATIVPSRVEQIEDRRPGKTGLTCGVPTRWTVTVAGLEIDVPALAQSSNAVKVAGPFRVGEESLGGILFGYIADPTPKTGKIFWYLRRPSVTEKDISELRKLAAIPAEQPMVSAQGAQQIAPGSVTTFALTLAAEGEPFRIWWIVGDAYRRPQAASFPLLPFGPAPNASDLRDLYAQSSNLSLEFLQRWDVNTGLMCEGGAGTDCGANILQDAARVVDATLRAGRPLKGVFVWRDSATGELFNTEVRATSEGTADATRTRPHGEEPLGLPKLL